jgi:hypothetical protein
LDEIHLWRWRFTDEFGKRRVTRWRCPKRRFARVPGRREGGRVADLEEQVARITPRTVGSALMAQLLSEPS